MTQLEPVEWSDMPFDIRAGRQDLPSRRAMCETFYRLCILDTYPIDDGQVAARGYAWRHLHDTTPDADFAAIVTRLARRPLLADEQRRVLHIAGLDHARCTDHTAMRAALADRYGARYGLPLRADFELGTKLSLVLRVLQNGPIHGYAVAQRIHQLSSDALQVEEGSLYPALQRILMKGWAKAEWGVSETNRRVRFYQLTAAGRKQLAAEMQDYERTADAIRAVLKLA